MALCLPSDASPRALLCNIWWPCLAQSWALDEAHATGGSGSVPTAEDAQRTALYRQLDERRHFVNASLAPGAAAADAAATDAAAADAAPAALDAFAASLNLRVDVSALDEEPLRALPSDSFD